jgi:hypothetical protein
MLTIVPPFSVSPLGSHLAAVGSSSLYQTGKEISYRKLRKRRRLCGVLPQDRLQST